MISVDDLQALYRGRTESESALAEQLREKSHRMGNLRGLSFASFVLAGVVYLSQGTPLSGALALAGLAAFFTLIPLHDRVIERERAARRRALQNEHALARVSGTWHGLPRAGAGLVPADHPYAGDLDLFGVGSLYQRISVAHTRFGQRTLAGWLTNPAEPEEIRARGEAMKELSSLLEFRQSLEAEAMALVEKKRGEESILTDGPDPEPLLAWVRSGPELPGGPLLVLLSFLAPLATIGGIFLAASRGHSPAFWAAPLALNLGLLLICRTATSTTFGAVSTTEGAFLRYGTLLGIIEELQVNATYSRERLARLSSEGGPKPSQVMGRFRRLVGWFDLRHNGMAYPFVNALLLWDIHCTRALGAWRKDARAQIREWFSVIGEFEALSSLAGLHHDEPESSIPEIVVHDARTRGESSQVAGPEGEGEAPVLSARALGHPLLSARTRVRNDVLPFGPGEALLVTGSNMSGKSTFLRAIGVNAVLAFSGGPVIAQKLTIPWCRLGTSIRVSDSLAGGVSHFYAEVKRLASVVEAAAGPVPVLFLLDEVLHGTNSRERQIGARWVLGELLRRKAFGIVTTHDMELCRLPDHLMKSVRQHHFRESVTRKSGPGGTGMSETMTFDYTLRDGPVVSGNALRLMRRVGLDVPLEEPDDALLPAGGP